ncbi:hypothetical protein AVEN_132482-1 [Araneus ventricosus]|uniref:Uncharacterized protein n=1 Tax=Araneus ventricosus TaxID=182803 RepID=A0A4Y2G0G7_ARAVE|nr:hypothetical protein AVEN_132482-1 [Araneus ventricosus]
MSPPLRANGVVALHTILFFSPSIYLGQLEPLRANRKPIRYASLRSPTVLFLPPIVKTRTPPYFDFLYSQRDSPSHRSHFSIYGQGIQTDREVTQTS